MLGLGQHIRPAAIKVAGVKTAATSSHACRAKAGMSPMFVVTDADSYTSPITSVVDQVLDGKEAIGTFVADRHRAFYAEGNRVLDEECGRTRP